MIILLSSVVISAAALNINLRLYAQQHWPAVPTYPHTLQEFLRFILLYGLVILEILCPTQTSASSLSHSVVHALPHFLDPSSLWVHDKQYRTEHWSLWSLHGQRADYLSAKSAMMLTIGQRMKRCTVIRKVISMPRRQSGRQHTCKEGMN